MVGTRYWTPPCSQYCADSDSKCHHQRKMAVLITGIIWLPFCTMAGRGDTSSIFIYVNGLSVCLVAGQIVSSGFIGGFSEKRFIKDLQAGKQFVFCQLK